MNTIVKIIVLQEETNKDIDNFVDLKREIVNTIFELEDKEEWTVLKKDIFVLISGSTVQVI